MLDHSSMLTSAIRGITVGIAPHKGGRERAEYSLRVPVWLRNSRGLPADEIADLLRAQHPELGIESEDQLYQELERATRARRDDIPWENEERREMTDAEMALRQFATTLAGLDAKTVSKIRDAWKLAYTSTGHKHLGRLIVSGDIESVVIKMQKKGKTDD
jgi:hypothetical protein